MTSQTAAVSHKVTEAYDLHDIVERELRENATSAEVKILQANPDLWKHHLLFVKRKTEVQFTTSRMRLSQLRLDYQMAKEDTTVTEQQLSAKLLEYQQGTLKENQWRSKANFFLSRIELRLSQLKDL